jgi:hypothetical protein
MAWRPAKAYDDYCVVRSLPMDPASCTKLTAVGYAVTPHLHSRLITLTSLAPRHFRQLQIPDNGREELSNETYCHVFVLETVAVAMGHPYPPELTPSLELEVTRSLLSTVRSER